MDSEEMDATQDLISQDVFYGMDEDKEDDMAYGATQYNPYRIARQSQQKVEAYPVANDGPSNASSVQAAQPVEQVNEEDEGDEEDKEVDIMDKILELVGENKAQELFDSTRLTLKDALAVAKEMPITRISPKQINKYDPKGYPGGRFFADSDWNKSEEVKQKNRQDRSDRSRNAWSKKILLAVINEPSSTKFLSTISTFEIPYITDTTAHESISSYIRNHLKNDTSQVSNIFTEFLGIKNRGLKQNGKTLRTARAEIDLLDATKQAEILAKVLTDPLLPIDEDVEFAMSAVLQKGNMIKRCYGTHLNVGYQTPKSWFKNEWDHVFPSLLYSCICGLEINDIGSTTHGKDNWWVTLMKTLTPRQQLPLEYYIFNNYFPTMIPGSIHGVINIMRQTRKKLLLLSTSLFNQSKCSLNLFKLEVNNTKDGMNVVVNENIAKDIHNKLLTGKHDCRGDFLGIFKNPPNVADFVDFLKERAEIITYYWGLQSLFFPLTNGQIVFLFSPIFTACIARNSKSGGETFTTLSPSPPIYLLAKYCKEYIDHNIIPNTSAQNASAQNTPNLRSLFGGNKTPKLEEIFQVMEAFYITAPQMKIDRINTKLIALGITEQEGSIIMNEELNNYWGGGNEYQDYMEPDSEPMEETEKVAEQGTDAYPKSNEDGFFTPPQSWEPRTDAFYTQRGQRQHTKSNRRNPYGGQKGGNRKKKTKKKYNYNKKTKKKKSLKKKKSKSIKKKK